MRIDSVGLWKHCQALLAGSVVLGFLCASALYAVDWLWHDVRITVYMERAEAVVSNVTERWVDGGDNRGEKGFYAHDFSYTFRSLDGRKVTRWASCGAPLPASTIGVEYERDNPENCRTEDDWRISRNYSRPLLILGVLVWVGGLAFIWCIGSINGSIRALWGSENSRARTALTRFGIRAATVLAPLYGESFNMIRQLWEGTGTRSSLETHRVISARVSALLIVACGAELIFGLRLGQIFTGSKWGYTEIVLALIGVGSYVWLPAAVSGMYSRTRPIEPTGETREDSVSDD